MASFSPSVCFAVVLTTLRLCCAALSSTPDEHGGFCFVNLLPFGLQGPSQLESIRVALSSRGSDGTDWKNYGAEAQEGLNALDCEPEWFSQQKWDATRNSTCSFKVWRYSFWTYYGLKIWTRLSISWILPISKTSRPSDSNFKFFETVSDNRAQNNVLENARTLSQDLIPLCSTKHQLMQRFWYFMASELTKTSCISKFIKG